MGEVCTKLNDSTENALQHATPHTQARTDTFDPISWAPVAHPALSLYERIYSVCLSLSLSVCLSLSHNPRDPHQLNTHTDARTQSVHTASTSLLPYTLLTRSVPAAPIPCPHGQYDPTSPIPCPHGQYDPTAPTPYPHSQYDPAVPTPCSHGQYAPAAPTPCSHHSR